MGKLPKENEKVFQPSIFMGKLAVSFREGKCFMISDFFWMRITSPIFLEGHSLRMIFKDKTTILWETPVFFCNKNVILYVYIYILHPKLIQIIFTMISTKPAHHSPLHPKKMASKNETGQGSKKPNWLVFKIGWLVVEPTHLKNIRQNGNPPQIRVKIKNVGNRHLVGKFPSHWVRVLLSWLIYQPKYISNSWNLEFSCQKSRSQTFKKKNTVIFDSFFCCLLQLGVFPSVLDVSQLISTFPNVETVVSRNSSAQGT